MKTLSIIIGVAVLIALAVLSRSVFGLEKPQYTLVSKTGKLEIRTYEPVMLASTNLKGEYREETRNGFRIIANYIFGGNKEAEKVAMTAPVLVENPDDADFTMAFVMPKDSVEKGLPTPQTDQLQLQSQNWGTVAVWSFGGWATEDRLAKEWTKMQEAMRGQNLSADAYDWIAQYNPPSMPPPFRHNEIWVMIESPTS